MYWSEYGAFMSESIRRLALLEVCTKLTRLPAASKPNSNAGVMEGTAGRNSPASSSL